MISILIRCFYCQQIFEIIGEESRIVDGRYKLRFLQSLRCPHCQTLYSKSDPLQVAQTEE